MKIIRYLVSFAKNVAISRTGQIFFGVHLILLMTALIQKLTTQQQIYPEHFFYEHRLFAYLYLANLPATILTGLLCTPIFISFDLDKNYLRELLWILIYVGWQTQWAIIGYWIEKLFRRKREKLS